MYWNLMCHCQDKLSGISSVMGAQHRLSEMFVWLFLQNYIDVPVSSKPSFNKSNWTHHTYFAIKSTAKTLYFGCTFETMGRLDAIIETLVEYPGVILVAEWEHDSSSIFGSHKELEKLWAGTNQHPNSDAFLFTYCPIETLHEFTKKVVEFWQKQATDRENKPSLFLVVVAYKREKKDEKFLFLRTHEITESKVILWHDLGFVTSDEYLEYIKNL